MFVLGNGKLSVSLAVPVLALLMLVLVGCGSDKTTSSSPPEESAPPSPPSGLEVVKATEAGLKLSWNPSPDLDVVGYEVYTSTNGSNYYDKLTTSPITKTTYLYRNPQEGNAYFFRVTAINTAGLESARTVPLVVEWDGNSTDPSGQDNSGDRPDRNGSPDGGSSGHPEDDEMYPDGEGSR